MRKAFKGRTSTRTEQSTHRSRADATFQVRLPPTPFLFLRVPRTPLAQLRCAGRRHPGSSEREFRRNPGLRAHAGVSRRVFLVGARKCEAYDGSGRGDHHHRYCHGPLGDASPRRAPSLNALVKRRPKCEALLPPLRFVGAEGGRSTVGVFGIRELSFIAGAVKSAENTNGTFWRKATNRGWRVDGRS